MIRPIVRLFLFIAFSVSACNAIAAPAMLKGVNLAGAEFAADKIPGVYAKDYIYPSPAIISAYAKFGMNVIRVPFLWERMETALGGPLNSQELKRLDEVVTAADAHHLTVILDLHNYGTYRGIAIGDKAVPLQAFAHFWQLLATHYRSQKNIAFGIMNEPFKQEAAPWAKAAKAALLAIRGTGAKQFVFIPGTLYTGAHSWNDKAGKRSNAQALAKLRDPAGHMAIEFHHYFDYNYSGTHNACTPPEVTEAALAPVSAWLAKTGHRGFLGEFGASTEPACLTALTTALKHLEQHSTVWAGWTYWGASEWFGNYPFTVYPVKPETFPQLTVLKTFLP